MTTEHSEYPRCISLQPEPIAACVQCGDDCDIVGAPGPDEPVDEYTCDACGIDFTSDGTITGWREAAMKLTDRDTDAVSAFTNFLSWGERPAGAAITHANRGRVVPPAWFAYVMGLTTWCPPKGEL